MHPSRWLLTSGLILALHAAPASAQFYFQHNLATNASDPDLVNPWGLTSGPTSPWWLADNGVDKSTLYTAAGVKNTDVIVSVPGAPTGAVFNLSPNAQPQFVLTATNNPEGRTGKAAFIFDTEEGTILAWNGGDHAVQVFPAPGEPPADPAPAFKGLAIAQVDSNDPASWRLFATNFSQGRGRRLRRCLPAGRRSGFRGPDDSGRLRAVWHPGDRRHDLRHLCAAEPGHGRRRGWARERLRERLRPAGPLGRASGLWWTAQLTVGSGVGVGSVRQVQRPPAGRQLRRRAHQRVRAAVERDL